MKTLNIGPLHRAAGTPRLTRCSILDVQYPLFSPTFAYRERIDPARLSHALAQVLSDIPTFAGRLVVTRQGYFIRHGVGASFEVVDSDASICDLESAANAFRTDLLCTKHSALRVLFGKQALLSIRLTLARDGCVIGFTFNHSTGDMSGVMTFMRAWSATYRGVPYEKPAIVFDQDAYLAQRLFDPPNSRPSLRIGSWRELFEFAAASRPGLRLEIDYSWQEVEAIQAEASGLRSVSANDALCAHAFLVLRRAYGAANAKNLCLAVDYRKRAHLPENVLGNLLTLVAQPVAAGDDTSRIAAGLRNQLDEFGSHGLNFHATQRLLEANPGWSKRIRTFSEYFQPGRGDFMVVSWLSFKVQELVFENSGPSLFRCMLDAPAWQGATFDTPNRAGITFGLYLPPSLAKRLDTPEGHALLRRPNSTWRQSASAVTSSISL